LAGAATGVPGASEAAGLILALAGVSDDQAALLRSIKRDTELVRSGPFNTGRTLIAEARRVGPQHPDYGRFLEDAQGLFYRALNQAKDPAERAVVAFDLASLYLGRGLLSDARHWYQSSQEACREAVDAVVKWRSLDFAGSYIYDKRTPDSGSRWRMALRGAHMGATTSVSAFPGRPTHSELVHRRLRARVASIRELLAFTNTVEYVAATIRAEPLPAPLELVEQKGGWFVLRYVS
jgi:hypothetical protein